MQQQQRKTAATVMALLSAGGLTLASASVQSSTMDSLKEGASQAMDKGKTMASDAMNAAKDSLMGNSSTKKAKAQPALTEWTCAQFLALDESYQPLAVAWASAYNDQGMEEDSVFDVEGIETLTPELITYCQQDPTGSFWDRLKKAMNKDM